MINWQDLKYVLSQMIWFSVFNPILVGLIFKYLNWGEGEGLASDTPSPLTLGKLELGIF